MFLGNLFSPDDPNLEGPPRPNFMDRLSRNVNDPKRQAFMQAGLDLMRAGGYSDRPVSLPQAIGAAGSSGLKTYHEAMRRKEDEAQEQAQRQAHEAALKREHELKSQDVQSEIQHRRESEAIQKRKQSIQEEIYREFFGPPQSPQAEPDRPASPADFNVPGEPPAQSRSHQGSDAPVPPPQPDEQTGQPLPASAASPAAHTPGQPLFQPGSDVPSPPVALSPPPPGEPPGQPLFQPGSDVPSPPMAPSPPPPGEPPDRPLPSSAARPSEPAQKDQLTIRDLIGAKMMGIDLSRIYEYEHGDRLAFEQTASRERAKKASTDLTKLSKGRREAATLKSEMMSLKQLLAGHSGSGMTGMAMKLAELGEGIGITLDKNLDDKQAAKALINQLTLKMRGLMGGMPGQLSDKDIAFLKAMVPSLKNTEAGRNLIIDRYISMLNKTENYSRAATRWISQYGSLENKEPESGLNFDGIWDEYQKAGAAQ